MPNKKANTAIVLFGATRWGRLDVPEQFESIGIDAIVPQEKEDPQALANKLNQSYQQWNVLTLDDFVGKEACALADLAPISMYPIEAYRAATHKHKLRQIWNQYVADRPTKPLHSVGWALYSEAGEVLHNHLSDQGPYIIKPNAYAGSVGMEMVNSSTEIAAAVSRTNTTMALEAAQYDEGLMPDTHVLVEDAIPRRSQGSGIAEYSVHMMSYGGKHKAVAFSEKNINKTSFIETAHLLPADLSAEYQNLMEQVCADLLSQLQVENLMSNWEFIITPEGKLGLIEGQLRPSGDKLMHLLQLSTRQNPYQYWIKQVLGLPVSEMAALKHTTITWLSPKEVFHGITSIEISELPDGVELIVDEAALLQCTNWPGPVDWYNRYISVVAEAETTHQLQQLISQVAKRVILKGTDSHGKPLITTCRPTN